MSKFDELKKAKSLIVLDGPMGTELERRGFNVSDALWSAKLLKENPDAIRQIHYDYFKAGADIVTCASYQASIPGFLAAGYSEEEAVELIRKSMELAKEARERWRNEDGKVHNRPYPMVAGDIGPYGAFLADGSEYTGNYYLTKEEYREFHQRRMQILLEAGAEIFAVETMPKLDEARACAELLEELGADYWISFTFRNAREISDGTALEEVAEGLKGLSHLKAIGVNCTPPEYVQEIITRLRSVWDGDICVYPNSGETYDGIRKIWLGAKDGMTFAERLRGWKDAGAGMIGGCCRTKPEDIQKVFELSQNL